MTNQTQLQWVLSQLKENGKVSRNHALQNRITRLSAIIQLVEAKGYVLNAYNYKTEHGKDYIYEVVKKPEPSKYQLFHDKMMSGEYYENRGK